MTTPMTEHERTQLVRYTRPERWPLLDRFPVSTALHERILAEILAAGDEDVRRRVQSLESRANAAAAELLADDRYREALHRLPLHGGDRLAALGDSQTADRLGWFEMMTRTMRLVGFPGVATHNLGLSGDTTADALERFDLLEAFRPTHVLVMLGTNDARRHGRGTDHRMVSPSETRRNLGALLDLITHTLRAQAVVITPPPADQVLIDAAFGGSTVTWSAADLEAVAALVREVAPEHIDIHPVLRRHPSSTYLDADGVHLSTAGQRLVAAEVAARLTTRVTAPSRSRAARPSADARPAGGVHQKTFTNCESPITGAT